MSYTPSIIEQLQLDTAAICQAAPYLNDVQVVVVRPRAEQTAVMIETTINQALSGLIKTNGHSGACVLVDMPKGEVPYPESPGPQLVLLCVLRVIENPIINMGATGTLKSAEDLTLALLNLFQGRTFTGSTSNILQSAYRVDRDAYEMIPQYLAEGKVGYAVKLRINMGVGGLVKTQGPTITGPASAVVINAPAGATAWYTTDGSYPSNVIPGTAAAYAAPFSTAPGTLVRVVAYAANQQASDLAAQYVS